MKPDDTTPQQQVNNESTENSSSTQPNATVDMNIGMPVKVTDQQVAAQKSPQQTYSQSQNITIDGVVPKIESGKNSNALKYASLILGGFIGLITVIALGSKDAGLVQIINNIQIIAGLALVFCMGMFSANQTSNGIKNRNNHKPYRKMSPLVSVGIFTLLLGMIITPFRILVILGIVVFVVGMFLPGKKVVPDINVKPVKTLPKVLLVVGGALLGGIPALVYAFVLYMMVSMHYCQLTSPKCM